LIGMEIQAPMAARFRLAELLEEAGLSQRELATRSGVSPTTINRMANNLTAQVSLKTLDSLARALSDAGKKVRPGDLIEDEPPKGKRGR
jgi:transcriptional regulator with XRE-family HTH domain